MRKDTEKRISEYHNRLPRLKERLIAALILFLVGTMMLTTVSFAWLSLSAKPEVSNITSSIAANGNLEIALASGTLKYLTAPGSTQLGDGNLPILGANLTWGNLINLSDPSYGLGNLVLRPAGLDKDNLLKSPLYGADFLASGKHEGYIDSFRYAKWQSTNPEDPNAPWEFIISDELGVRAISSTIITESSGYAYELEIKRGDVMAALREAQNAYIDITCNVDIVDGVSKNFLECLAYVMGAYMTANMNATQDDNEHLINATMDPTQMQNFRDLFRAFIKVLELEQEAMRQLANLQLFVFYGGEKAQYSEFATFDALQTRINSNNSFTVTDDAGKTTTYKLKISGLTENVSDLAKVRNNYNKLVELCDAGGEIKWKDSGLNNVVNDLVNVGICTVQNSKLNGGAVTKVSAIGAGAALDVNNQTCQTTITNGILFNFEKRTGADMDVPRGTTALEQKYPKGLPVKAKGKRLGMEMDGTIYAMITTNAPSPSLFQQDLDYAEEKNTGGAAALRANDTYGFAIDFWVRTNASGSFLTLQGNVLTETIEEDAKGLDAEGNEVQLYVVTIQQTDPDTGEDTSYSFEVYSTTSDNPGASDPWYYAVDHAEYTYDTSNPPKKKVNITQNVIGFEGENRVWENNAFISVDSTTQGSGSCYVYYYNTPEDMERSLKLLSAMNVAFVGDDGTLLAEGFMDTAHYFDDNGKVIVPLQLTETAITIKNPDGTETRAIAPLEQNVAKLVTAIVYLDGTKIENHDVLAASEIQGQLNIQFGSTADFSAMSNEKLASEYLSVDADVDKTEFEYDVYRANGEPMLTNVSVNVSGSTPESVAAFFVRQISATQAIPLNGPGELMTFTDAGGGNWTSSFTFNSPGTYIIRSIWIDGIEYDLEPDERPKVVVEGFTVKRLQWQSGAFNKSFMTAAGSVSDQVSLEFVTSDVENMPSSVEGRFLRTDGNSVNVKFERNSNNIWVGEATFLSSGEYTFEFLYFDSAYYPVDTNMQIVADVYLGMKTAVVTSSPLSFVLGSGIDNDPSNGMADNEENLYMKIKIMDDTGKEMPNLDNVKLYYAIGNNTTPVNGLDADLEWNQSTGYYEGEFRTKAGVFRFLYVTVGDNVIRTATTSPRFVIQSPTPPSFNVGNAEEWQYKPDYDKDPAKISVYLNDTDGIDESSMIGIISNGTVEYRVAGKNMGDGEWQFTVPRHNGSQDGTWTLTRIDVVGIYHDGTVTTEEDPFVIDLAGKDKLTTTVLSVINITMDVTSDVKLEGTFLQTHTLTNDKLGGVTIVDKNGNALPGMGDTVTLVYTYGKDSVAKGGYTINFNAPETVTVTLKKNATGKYFAQDAAALATLKYAGTYTLSSLSFNFDGGVVTLTGAASLPDAATITVSSATPTVVITGKGVATNATTSVGSLNSITVNFESYDGNCGTNYRQPFVVMTMSGYGQASSATLTFSSASGGEVHLYKNNGDISSKKVSSFEWTGNGECKRWVGYWQQSDGTDPHTAAGTLQATELILTDGSGTYTVAVTITINNPS